MEEDLKKENERLRKLVKVMSGALQCVEENAKFTILHGLGEGKGDLGTKIVLMVHKALKLNKDVYGKSRSH